MMRLTRLRAAALSGAPGISAAVRPGQIMHMAARIPIFPVSEAREFSRSVEKDQQVIELKDYIKMDTN